MARPIFPLSSLPVTTTKRVTEPPEPSAPPPPSTALGPLSVPQNQISQFEYLPQYDWPPASSSLPYLPLFPPADLPALPLPAVSRPFLSHAHPPTSHSPFPLLGTGMLNIHPDTPHPATATATAAQPATDPQKKEMAREPSVPPPSIRKSLRLKTGERGSDKDSTGDDHDPVEDVPAGLAADSAVSRIRRTWASIYEDDVLTSDESVDIFSPRQVSIGR